MNIVNVTAPFDIDTIKKYFEDKDNTVLVIDYDQSTLKGSALITYLSNIGIYSDIVSVSDKQDLKELLREYLTTNLLVEIPSFTIAAICCLLARKGLNISDIDCMMSVEDINDFNEQNADLMTRLETILTSCSVYNLYTVNVDEFKEWAESLEHIDDDQYVGVNFVHMFYYIDFFRFYEKVDRSLYKFFDKQFNEYMFKGQPLYTYWHNENNIISLMTFAIASGKMDSEAFVKALEV